LYGFIVYTRSKFFDWGILKREEFDIPVVCIGNITAGGTGKTPHTEYIIRLLQEKYRVGVLSRGYKRKSKGFVLAAGETACKEIGDEPFQIKTKFPHVIVAVDGNRRRGIRKLQELDHPPQIILLDDAFQHRYVKPSYTILLSDFNRPVYEDKLLPAGRLREPASVMTDANMIIVTKCPTGLQPIDYRIISYDINAFPYQELYFTTLVYKGLKPVFADENKELSLDSLAGQYILLVTGIASPDMLIGKLSEYTGKIENIAYPDHHDFKTKDIKYITSRFRNIRPESKIIVVTEKDAARLIHRDDIEDDIKRHLYYLPVEVLFIDKEAGFKEKILRHITDGRFKLR
jgi:tetraacyldisaccharide 4'-kinase